MSKPAPGADDFWAAVTALGWGSADTDVMSDDELLELASGLGPVLVSHWGAEPLISTLPSPAPGADEVVFHTEDTLEAERVAWVVLHCAATNALRGGGTALASADHIAGRLSPADRAVAEDATGTLRAFAHQREWRLLTRRPGGGWSIDLPGATRLPGGDLRGYGELLIPDPAHRAVADLVEAMAAEVPEAIEWVPGRVLVFDNRRYLHTRLPVARGTRTVKRVLVGAVPG
jgi:hypothetical protein